MDKITGIKMTFDEFRATVEKATDGVETAIKDMTWCYGGINEASMEENEIVEGLVKYLNVNSIDQIVVNCDENDFDDTVIIVYH